jgi:hypothetical protein
MPTPIILSSIISSWPLIWAVLAGAIVAVIAISVLLALVTRPRRGTHRPATAARGEVRHEALV